MTKVLVAKNDRKTQGSNNASTKEDAVPNNRDKEDPISIPFSSPVSETTENDDSISSQPMIKDFVSDDLPDFVVSIPEDWTDETKSFFEEDSKGFSSHYFAYYDTDISACDDGCMGVRFQKSEVALELVFDLVLDDGGTICSDTAELQKLSAAWYRIKDENGYYYSQNIVENETVTNPEWNYTIGGKTQAEKDHTYKFCDHLSGNDLLVDPPTHFSDGGIPNASEVILMEKPRIIGNPDEETLQQIDQMVMSIQGVERKSEWLYR